MFSSDGRDGKVSVCQQKTPDSYEALASIPTVVSARNMTVDTHSGRVLVVGADTQPNLTPAGRPKIKAGTVRVMIFDPVA